MNYSKLPYDGPALLTLTFTSSDGASNRESRHADIDLQLRATPDSGAYEVVLGDTFGTDLLKDPGLTWAKVVICTGGMLQGRVHDVHPQGHSFVMVEDLQPSAV